MTEERRSSRSGRRGGHLPYDQWMESLGLPIYRGHSVENPLALDLGWWEERGCYSAFIQLQGQEGIGEARITEIPPGQVLPSQKFGFGEAVYVLEGQGIATIWDDQGTTKSFEWQKRSLFYLPRHCHHQLGNARGDQRVRLLHYNFLPMAMSAVPEPDFFINNPFSSSEILSELENTFSEAKQITEPAGSTRWPQGRVTWSGNFFPDMQAWDKLIPFRGRGAGGHVVWIRFPGSPHGSHMSVFDPQLYKKAHKHGPGRIILIPKGEGYSVLWPEGGEKVVCPWEESTIFAPPENWYHQHFNVGDGEARYMTMGTPPQFSGDAYRRQIEYIDEDHWIREYFEAELAKRGRKSLMPDKCYTDRSFDWDYGDDN